MFNPDRGGAGHRPVGAVDVGGTSDLTAHSNRGQYLRDPVAGRGVLESEVSSRRS